MSGDTTLGAPRKSGPSEAVQPIARPGELPLLQGFTGSGHWARRGRWRVVDSFASRSQPGGPFQDNSSRGGPWGVP